MNCDLLPANSIAVSDRFADQNDIRTRQSKTDDRYLFIGVKQFFTKILSFRSVIIRVFKQRRRRHCSFVGVRSNKILFQKGLTLQRNIYPSIYTKISYFFFTNSRLTIRQTDVEVISKNDKQQSRLSLIRNDSARRKTDYCQHYGNDVAAVGIKCPRYSKR